MLKSTTDDVVMLATPVEGIYLTAHAALNPGDEVIVLSPAYDALINTFEYVVGTVNVRKMGIYFQTKTIPIGSWILSNCTA